MEANDFCSRNQNLRLYLLSCLCLWRRSLTLCICSLLAIKCAFFMMWFAQPEIKPLESSSQWTRGRNHLLSSSIDFAPRDVIHHHHTFRYIINEPHFCLGKPPFLLIFVSSSPSHDERRNAIRQTWATELNRTEVAVVFVLGFTSNKQQLKNIQEESMNYRDVIQMDFVDSYKNLTLKSVAALKWCSSFCPGVKYMMKTDDDIYVNVPLLTEFLRRNIFRKRWIVGCIKQHVGLPVKMEAGQRISTAYPLFPGHPHFTAGAGYVISGDVIEDLSFASSKIRLIPVEDVFVTAHCARVIGVMPDHDDRFSCGQPVFNHCSMAKSFTGHHVFPKRQFQIWKTLNSGNFNLCNYRRSHDMGQRFHKNFL